MSALILPLQQAQIADRVATIQTQLAAAPAAADGFVAAFDMSLSSVRLRREALAAKQDVVGATRAMLHQIVVFQEYLQNVPLKDQLEFAALPKSERGDLELTQLRVSLMSTQLRLVSTSIQRCVDAIKRGLSWARRNVPIAVFTKIGLPKKAKVAIDQATESLSICRDQEQAAADLLQRINHAIEEHVETMRSDTRDEARPWVDYFERLGTQPRGLTQAQVNAARTVWWQLLEEHRVNVPLPTVVVTDEKTIRLAWSASGKFLDIECYDNGRVEWFFADDEARVVDGSEEQEACVPLAFFERVQLFVAAQGSV